MCAENVCLSRFPPSIYQLQSSAVTSEGSDKFIAHVGNSQFFSLLPSFLHSFIKFHHVPSFSDCSLSDPFTVPVSWISRSHCSCSSLRNEEASPAERKAWTILRGQCRFHSVAASVPVPQHHRAPSSIRLNNVAATRILIIIKINGC